MLCRDAQSSTQDLSDKTFDGLREAVLHFQDLEASLYIHMYLHPSLSSLLAVDFLTNPTKVAICEGHKLIDLGLIAHRVNSVFLPPDLTAKQVL